MLIIYAHPNHDGHCGYILQEIEKVFKARHKKYQVWDLYQMDYDPILKNSELYTQGKRKVGEKNQALQKIIASEKEFIYIYPTWWNSPPAILKGFLDRVFTSHFAFTWEGNIPVGLLKGKALVITTTGGPVLYEKWVAGDRSLKIVANDTLKFCGFKTKTVMVGNARKFTDENKRIIEQKIKPAVEFFR